MSSVLMQWLAIEIIFGGTHFKVSAMLPMGEISNHYEMKDWDLFVISLTDKAKFPFDWHNPQDVLERLKDL